MGWSSISLPSIFLRSNFLGDFLWISGWVNAACDWADATVEIQPAGITLIAPIIFSEYFIKRPFSKGIRPCWDVNQIHGNLRCQTLPVATQHHPSGWTVLYNLTWGKKTTGTAGISCMEGLSTKEHQTQSWLQENSDLLAKHAMVTCAAWCGGWWWV